MLMKFGQAHTQLVWFYSHAIFSYVSEVAISFFDRIDIPDLTEWAYMNTIDSFR